MRMLGKLFRGEKGWVIEQSFVDGVVNVWDVHLTQSIYLDSSPPAGNTNVEFRLTDWYYSASGETVSKVVAKLVSYEF